MSNFPSIRHYIDLPIFTTGHDYTSIQSVDKGLTKFDRSNTHLFTFQCTSFWFALIRVDDSDSSDLVRHGVFKERDGMDSVLNASIMI